MLSEQELDDLIEYVEHQLVDAPNDVSWTGRLDGLHMIRANYCLIEAINAVLELNPAVNERAEAKREERRSN